MADKQVKYTITLQDGISAPLKNVNKTVDELEKNLGSVKTKSESFFGSMAKFAGLTAIASGVMSLGGGFVQMASDMEQSKVSFEVLLGSGEKATKMLGDIKSMADKTPFEMKDLQQSAQTLLGFQVSSEKVLPALKALGDVSSGNAEKMRSMTLAYAQIQASGKLLGNDLNQLITAGFNPLGEMARTTGKDVSVFKDQMSKGGISAKMVEDAFVSATSKGGPFFEMMDKQSRTFAGRMSTLKDKINTVGVGVVNSLLPALMNGIEFISTLIDKGKNFADAFKPLITMFSTIGATIKKSFEGIDTSIFTLDNFIKGLKGFMEWLSPVFQVLGNFFTKFWNSFMNLIGSLSQFIEPLMNLFNFIKHIFIWIIDTIGSVISTVINFTAGIIDVLHTIYFILDKLYVLKALKVFLMGIWEVIKFIGNGIAWVYNHTIKPIIDLIVSGYKLVKELLGITTKDIKLNSTIKTIAQLEKKENKGTTTKTDNATITGTGPSKPLSEPSKPSTVKSNTPDIINITIDKLIESFTIETTNVSEGVSKIKEMVAQALLEAVNDVGMAK